MTHARLRAGNRACGSSPVGIISQLLNHYARRCFGRARSASRRDKDARGNTLALLVLDCVSIDAGIIDAIAQTTVDFIDGVGEGRASPAPSIRPDTLKSVARERVDIKYRASRDALSSSVARHGMPRH